MLFLVDISLVTLYMWIHFIFVNKQISTLGSQVQDFKEFAFILRISTMTACGITRQMSSRLRHFSQLQKINQSSILTPNSGNFLMPTHVITNAK